MGVFETVWDEKFKILEQKNQYTNTAVIDCFSGCGGMSTGFEWLSNLGADITHLAAFDNDEHSVQTYNANIANVAQNLDLLHFEDYEVFSELRSRVKKFQRSILIGCAPCQGFSSLTKSSKTQDARNNLLVRFCDMVSLINPSIFIVENVPDLLSQRHRTLFNFVSKQMTGLGYQVNSRIVNMADYGVPQQRYRTVLIGMNSGYAAFPDKLYSKSDYKTVRDAIGSLPPISSGQTCQKDKMHQTSKHRASTLEIFKQVSHDGGSRPSGVGPKCLDRVKGYYDVYGRLYWDRPAVTITARCRTPSCGRFTHPVQDRGLSVREAALLQSFPSNFEFKGPFDDKYKQIGNAVPPLFSLALANQLCSKKLHLDQAPREQQSFASYGIYIAHERKQNAI